MLATPVSGIIAALKAVYDLVQFVRSNMAAIGGLVQAVTACLGAAAYGDSSGVANGVEAALCRLIPLAIDLLLRLAGIDVGDAIQKVVGMIREKVNAAIGKLVGKFKGSKVGQVYQKGKDKVDGAKAKANAVKDAAKKKFEGAVDKKIDKIGSKVDPMINKGVDKFNNSATGKKLAGYNNKAQSLADKTNAFTSSAKEKTSPAMGRIGTATDVLNDLASGEKYGDAYGLSSEKMAKGVKGAFGKKKNSNEKQTNAEIKSNSDNKIKKLTDDSKNDNVVSKKNDELSPKSYLKTEKPIQGKVEAKEDAWQSYKARQAAAGKEVDYARWSKTYDSGSHFLKDDLNNKTREKRSLLDMTPREIVNLTREELNTCTPDGWVFEEHNGRIHIKSDNDAYRVRIDPPDRVVNYTHIHIYDEYENSLDVSGNIVPSNDISAHIPYNH